MKWILRKLLGLAASRPGLRHAARRLVVSVPLLAQCLSWLMARANADMVAAAGRANKAQAGARIGAGFGNRDRLLHTARGIVARHRELHEGRAE